MTELIYKLHKKIQQSEFNIFKKDTVFAISFVLAVTSCFIYTPKLEYIDFKVLASLFNLMLVVKALEELKILDKLAIAILNRCSNSKKVSLVLILLCFFSSMLITNDVALITFVPLTLIISKKAQISMLNTIVFQTLGTNIGSSLTPMGNPQNLFIFSHYNIAAPQFFETVLLFVVLGGTWLYLLNNRLDSKNLDISLPSIKIENGIKAAIWIVVFCIITSSILGIIDYKLAFIITLLAVVLLNRKLFVKIDYLLLVTFVCFFVFIGNISNIDAVHVFLSGYLNDTASIYFGSIISSQFISNVPSSILLSGFTNSWRPLLLGVNLGGMGTIIASLASVISYKLFIKDNPDQGKAYMMKFSIYNFLSLILLAAVCYLILIFFK